MIVERMQAALRHRWAPAVLGIVTALSTWYVWGSLAQRPFISDEAAYVLQARIFARGRWTAPAPPLPEFFEQAHVLLRPAIAAKYPPGHALALAPGAALGLPGLIPVLFAGLSGALVFALARRLAGAPVALLAWLVWALDVDVVRYHASYLSETTSGALWLIGWWALLDWHETRRPSRLLLTAAAVAWCAVTRPLTAVAYAIPVAAVVLRSVAARRAWRELAAPLALGAAVLALLPLWSARTTGDWRRWPLTEYTEAYMPWDVPGFGLTERAPTIRLPADQQAVEDELREVHRKHTPAALPAQAAARLENIARTFGGGGLVPFALLGLWGAGAPALVGLATFALLFVLYLSYAHLAVWVVYYLEAAPVLAFLIALGIWRLCALARAEAAGLALATAVGLAVWLGATAHRVHLALVRIRTAQVAFASAIAGLPGSRVIVFVRYAPGHYNHLSFIRNEPFLDEAPRWFVYDRGPENARLLAAAPDRAAYLADEATQQFTVLRAPTAR
jgi:hypothetical protein